MFPHSMSNDCVVEMASQLVMEGWMVVGCADATHVNAMYLYVEFWELDSQC